MSSSRRFALGICALVASVVVVLLAVVTAAFVAGVSIDVSRWREMATERASAALGRRVDVQGALQLTLGREPMLRLDGVRILNPPGFASPGLLSIGEARVSFGLFDLLGGSPRLHRVEAEDVELWLERDAQGRANWSPTRLRDPAAQRATFDIAQIALQRLSVHYREPGTAMQRDFAVASLTGSAGTHEALQLSVRGPLDAQHAYRLEVEGGPLGLLQDAAAPWPLNLDFHANGVSVQAGGVFDASQGEARFDFNAAVEDLAREGQRLGLSLPRTGGAALLGRAVIRDDAIKLAIRRGTLAGVEYSGQLAVAFGGPRKHLSGALQIDALDPRPWLAAGVDTPVEELERSVPAWQALALRDLVPIDAELELRVDRWVGLPIEVRDASLMLHADARGLRAPMSATLAGAKVTGQLALDATVPTPALSLELVATDLAFGDLARDTLSVENVEGRLGRFGVRITGRGDTLGAWLQDVKASVEMTALDARLSRGQEGKPRRVALDALILQAGPGERLHGSAGGVLLGERVGISILGGRLPDMLNRRTLPIELKVASGQTTLTLATDLARVGGASDTVLDFQLHAPRSGDLARWLGVAIDSTLPVVARGRLRLAEEAWHFDPTTLQLGRSQMVIEAKGSRAEGGPITAATVRAARLDVQELASLRATATPGPRSETPQRASTHGLPDLDLRLELHHVLLGRTDLQDIGLAARLRNGQLLPSSITGQVAGTPFNGIIEFDLRDELPLAKLELNAGEVDVGSLLRELGIAEGIAGRADALQFSLQSRGATLRDFMANADIKAQLLGGDIRAGSAPRHAAVDIRVHEATLGAAPGEPVRVQLKGLLHHSPVQIELSSGTLADAVRDAGHLPFAMTARAAGALLTLDGEAALPIGRDATLRFSMSGDRLDSLNDLARVELPAWGPWSFGGPIRMTPTGYELKGLQLAVGQSRLSGYGRLDLSGPKPFLKLQVSAPSIQLDDFPLPEHMTEAPSPAEPNRGLRDTAGDVAARTDRLLGAHFLRRFDASIDVQAKEVLAGTDRLADGELHLQLRDGILDLDPAVVNMPGGRMRLSLYYDLKQSELDFAVAAKVERFDYGIIARRLGRADDLRGLFSMNLAIQGNAPSLDTIMRNTNGRVDVAVWPTEMRSGVFNLWSVNLVLEMLPLIDAGGTSQVNCLIGRFDLKDGIASDDKIIIDTTTLRIRGAGHANLATEQLSFVFRPRAKGLALFRLQTPLRVTGTLSDQHFGHERADTVESVLRLIASPILLPIERLTLGPLPRDGADICTDPLRAAGD